MKTVSLQTDLIDNPVSRPIKPILCFAITILIGVICLLGPTGCSHSNTETTKKAEISRPHSVKAKILQSWQGDYPVDQLNLLPESQREQAIGFIGDAKPFKAVWEALKPGENIPEIDFKANLVLFARNTHFYNRISIGRVDVTDGVVELLAMETMSAMPIEDRVAMSLVMVARKGITAVQSGDEKIPIN